ncbi:LysR family transcriptional regulator [Humitalea rosea]|uniref:LysR family transcriptional regulator n=1 Tax=Humitalea rosea TaxID=990373 RepID=A0A2W7IIC2_9PROT|nr:LysR family transcriptional regulator [Humitalea rosea]PZW37729.1 LysR family transcriptional regulator [Humitalea rosea]
MTPTFRHFAAFARVARLGSFARAAEALGMSQPALSQSIAQMELLLGVKLLQRTTRAVRLTAEGEVLLPRAEAILASVEEAVALLRERPSLRLSVGSLPSLARGFLAEILRHHRERYPATQLAVTDGTSEVLYAGIEAGQLDLAISSRLRGHAGVTFLPVLRERFKLVLRRDHVLAGSETVTWREALAHDFIAFPPGSGGHAAMHDALDRAGLVLRPVMTLAQSNTMMDMVEAGVGVTALPALGCPAPDHRLLTTRPLVAPVVDRDVGILRAAAATPSAAMLALQEIVMECVAGSALPGMTPDAGLRSRLHRRAP